MPAFKDITGQRFGRLVVVGFLERRRSFRYYTCRCDCGTTKVIRKSNLTSGATKSCGCLHKDVMKNRVIHGLSYSREYSIWKNMIQRCTNPWSAGYHLYGGRGITVCNDWRESFESFYRDMGRCPSSTHSIDRINPNGDYCPDNCRWATPYTQAHNTRMSIRNRSGCKGISWYRAYNKWAAEIKRYGRKHFLGYFDDWFEAVCARKSAEHKYRTRSRT